MIFMGKDAGLYIASRMVGDDLKFENLVSHLL